MTGNICKVCESPADSSDFCEQKCKDFWNRAHYRCAVCCTYVLIKNSKAHDKGPCLLAQIEILQEEMKELRGKIRGKEREITRLGGGEKTYRLREQLNRMRGEVKKRISIEVMASYRRILHTDEVTEIGDLIEVDLEERMRSE